MPSLKLVVDGGISEKKRKVIIDKVRQRFLELPDTIRDDAVLAVTVCEITHGKNANPYWLEVRCSMDTPPSEVVQIANHFVAITDVEAYNPVSGAFVFKAKGGGHLKEL